MAKEISTISPEGLDIANSYLLWGNIGAVCEDIGIPRDKAVEVLSTRPVQRYLDAVYLDTGYRNRNNIARLLDEMIESKIEEAQETRQFTSKDLAELIQMAHKMRIDELKLQEAAAKNGTNIKNQTNVQINNEGSPFGQGHYGKLMETLLNAPQEEVAPV